MYYSKRQIVLVLFLLVIIVASRSTVEAQSFWNEHPGKPAVTLEVVKPNFKTDRFSTTTGAVFLTGQVPFGPNGVGVAEIPVAHASYASEFSSYRDVERKNLIGNVYLGVQTGNRQSPTFVDIGVRLPTAREESDPTDFVGQFADPDRLFSFTPNSFTVSALVNYRQRFDENFFLRFRVGPTMWNYSDNGRSETEFFGQYGAQLGAESRKVCFAAAFSGVVSVTGDDMSITERTYHQLEFRTGLKLNNVRPSLFVRAPLDWDLSAFINSTIGLCVTLNELG